jgi:TDG/mug DNA glycosylase family protein
MLDDLLVPNLRLVFCGTAAGTRSAAQRAYYAGIGNKFWPTLAAVGLTPRQLEANDFRELLQFGIGLTDLVQDQAGPDERIRFSTTAVDRFRDRILTFRPACLAFNGKRAARVFLGVKHIDFGLQRSRIGDTALYCVPSTSGLAARHWDLAPWRQLAQQVPARATV